MDEPCRTIPDSGPLTPRGRERIAGMLRASAWHHHAFCLVAEHEGRIAGFVNGSPEARGQGTSRRLAEAAVAWLRDRDVWMIRSLVCADDAEARAFWVALGFQADIVCPSSYRAVSAAACPP